MPFAVNPRWSDLPHVNALLNGVVRTEYIVADYETTLSIKTVAAGEAWYSTPQGRYRVTPTSSDSQRGTALFDGSGSDDRDPRPFFAPGFVGDALRAEQSAEARLLDRPEDGPLQTDFVEQLHPMSGATGTVIRAMHTAVRERRSSQPLLEDQFHELARALVRLRNEDAQSAATMPAVRRTTREELCRRLCRARDFLYSAYAQPISVSDAASIATLSPSISTARSRRRSASLQCSSFRRGASRWRGGS